MNAPWMFSGSLVRMCAMVCAGLVLAGCVQDSDTPTPPPATNSRLPSDVHASPKPSPTGLSPSREESKDILGKGESGVTTRAARLSIWREPKASNRVMQLPMRNPLDQQLVLLVTDAEQQVGGQPWYRVLIPERPNGKQGWVRGGDVKVVRLHDRIEIDLSEYRLEHFRDDKLVDRFKVGIGESQWPSPVGEFYVWAKVPQPGSQGAYGVYALGLSGFSPVLSDWPGGGRAAIHGTTAAWNKGKKVSHGCIRVFNPDMQKLRHLPMGTPVIITR